MSVHARLGVAVIVVAAVGTLFALWARARPSAIPTVRVFVQLCAVVAALEAVLGLVMVVTGNRPGQAIHYFYGAATVIPIPAAELLARRVRPESEMLYLLAGVAATALFGLRAVTTGSM
ncbi:MAG: hypothetical protein JF886_10835 [Candidatus Dormibacteraeota bacterium]|uniref:Uncharacterized protein n=1 Tax=Candidatus Aeolococcus gillhamiae TaxID=3127015 RepID=A0A934K335_9BACT|nr:hypothetical protein [Candidatus Dormibacteraeota bacterium]